MKKLVVILVFVACLAALWLYQARNTQTAQLETEIAAARAEREAQAGENRTALQKLEEARNLQQLEEARAKLAAAEKAEAKSRQAAKSNTVQDPFLKKVHNLMGNAAAIYEQFEKTPQAMIPELDLLTEQDWIDLAERNGHLSTPEEVQRALALVRIRAKQHCLDAFSNAVYAVPDRKTITDIRQLRPHLSPSISDEMLDRYEIPDASQFPEIAREAIGASQITGGATWWILREKAVPPGAFDDRAYWIDNGRTLRANPGWCPKLATRPSR